jgi:hypothetical protein
MVPECDKRGLHLPCRWGGFAEFPKLFYLALRNISQKWTMPIRDWKAALTRFTIQFGDRISVN